MTSQRARVAPTGPIPYRSISPGAGGVHGLAEPLVAVVELVVERDQVGEQFRGGLPAGSPGDITWPDSGQQRLGLGGGQKPRTPPPAP